jgi:hypothetical protein
MSSPLPLESRVPELAKMHLDERARDPNLSVDLEYAGSGGEHVVFRVKSKEKEGEYRPLVVKANTYYLRRGLIRKVAGDWEAAPFATKDDARVRKLVDSLHERRDDVEKMKEEIERENDFFKALKSFFNEDEILRTRSVIREVPITPEIAKEILEVADLTDLSPSETVMVPTIVKYQKTIPQEADTSELASACSFGFNYAERYDMPFSEYSRLNAMCVGEAEFDEAFFRRFLHKGTIELLDSLKTDDELRGKLTELVRKIIRFTQIKREMVDLAGRGNLRLYKDANGEWEYLFVDPWAGMEWENARSASANDFEDRGAAIDDKKVSDILNAINYMRLLNGFAILLGISERLEIFHRSAFKNKVFSDSMIRVLRRKTGWPNIPTSLKQRDGVDEPTQKFEAES